MRVAAGGPRLDEPLDRHGPRLAGARTIGSVDVVLMNDAELRMLHRAAEPGRAAREGGRWGRRRWWPSRASTARRCSPASGFFRPAGVPPPARRWWTPRGAGDSFMGGFLGATTRLTGRRARRPHAAPRDDLRLGAGVLQRRGVRAERVRRLTRARRIDERFEQFRSMTTIEKVPTAWRLIRNRTARRRDLLPEASVALTRIR